MRSIKDRVVARQKISILLLMALFSVLLSFHAAQAGNVIRIGGTGSGLPALRALAHAYMKKHPEVTIRVVPSLGSPGGMAALKEGALELAIAARPPKDTEGAAAVTAVEYAKTPFVFAVHRDVPNSDLTTAELAGILSGKTRAWSNGTPIRLILRPANDTDTGIIRSISPAVADAMEKAQRRAGLMMAATNEESARTVCKVPGALAASTLTEMLADKRRVKLLSYNGVKPTVQGVLDGRYPLVKTFYLLIPQNASTAARGFASFMRSSQGEAILSANGNLTPHNRKR